MPFTLCHPAIVLPLYQYSKRITSLPALVIGSMAPDFAYFFSFGISGSFTHTAIGVPLYCIPVGLVVYLIYQSLIRKPMLAWLPCAISTRMSGSFHWPLREARSLAAVVSSLTIGAASHIGRDSFTHPNTLIVNSYDIFRKLIPLWGYHIPLLKILQHLSSLAGLIVIAGFVAVWFKRAAPGAVSSRSLTLRQRLLTIASVGLAVVTGAAASLWLRPTESIEHLTFNLVVTGMATGALAIICLCFLWHMRERRNAASASSCAWRWW